MSSALRTKTRKTVPSRSAKFIEAKRQQGAIERINLNI